MQAKNKIKSEEERKRQESIQIRRQLLKDKVVGDCRQVLKKKGGFQDNGEPLDNLPKARTLTLPDRQIFKSPTIVYDEDRRYHNETEDVQPDNTSVDEEINNLPKPSQPTLSQRFRFKRLGSKTASNMKEIKNGIGFQKLVGYEEKTELFKKSRLPSMGSQTSGTVPSIVFRKQKRESTTPANNSKVGGLFKDKIPGNELRSRKLAPMLTRAISETPKEDRALVSNSIIQKNIELISQMSKNYSHITDVNVWIKKKGLPQNTKVFIVSPAYPDIKAALEHRGWLENPDYDSNCFHLKYSLKCRDIGYNLLQSFQVVNHFEKATTITTKSGLSKSVKNMIWCCHEDIDTFFPRCYDTVDDAEYEAFQSYYKVLKAEAVLKEYIGMDEQGRRRMVDDRRGQIQAAITVTNKRLVELDDIIDAKGTWTDVTQAEWEELGYDEKRVDRDREASVDFGIAGKNKKNDKKNIAVKRSVEVSPKIRYSRSMELNGSMITNDVVIERNQIDLTDISQTTELIQSLIYQVAQKFPQTSINGQKNIWIVKPAGLSRGRGIKLFDCMADIHNYSKGKDTTWVIQKYIEHPLLYKNRKLDIRQWVMVTDWNPLTVWFYQECYIRLSFSDYDLANISDRFCHLTNNSINKHAKNFEKKDGFLSQEDFSEYLKTLNHPNLSDPFFQKIQPKMKEIVKNTLLCVQDMVENRQNSSEIYGYDFCIDDQLNPWLIEINASPAWDYSSVVYDFSLDGHRTTDQASQRRLHQSDGRLQHGQPKAKASHRHRILRKYL